MNENLKLLQGATEQELASCLQLLALSVAQHREKSGFVSLGSSLDTLLAGGADDGATGDGVEVLEEALERIRVAAAEAAQVDDSAAAVELASPAEKRSQYRVNVRIPIRVLWPGQAEPREARLENISWGGAAIHVDRAALDEGDTLRVILPNPGGEAISIEAKFLRCWDLADGGQGIAVRFSSLSTRDEAQLETILEKLVQSSDEAGGRQHARLSQRLDIQLDCDQELRATLDDISAGGMGITVPDPLQIGQSLQAIISSLDDSYSLKLRARVVRQEPVKMGRVELYNVGLKFEHPGEELHELTGEMLRRITGRRDEGLDRMAG